MTEPTSKPAPSFITRLSQRQGRLWLQTLGFTAGALTLLCLPQLPSAWWLLALILPALLPWPFRKLYAVTLLGVLLTFWQAQSRLDERWPQARDNDEVLMQGAIVSLPEAEATNAADATHQSNEDSSIAPDARRNWHFLFAPDRAARAAGAPSRIRTAWYRSDALLKGGQCWQFSLRLRAPHGSLNPGGSDYEEWMFRQDIGASASVRAASACDLAEGHYLLRLRQSISDQLQAWLPDHPAEPLIAALAVADKTRLRQSDWDVFRQTGTVHLMVIAGLHVGFLAAFAFWLCRSLWSLSTRLCLRWPAQRAGLAGSVIAALAYALLADLDAPVLRATLMLVTLAAAALFGGLARPSRALMLAWLAVVGSDPLGLLAPGLWLSFGAVAAILYLNAGSRGAGHTKNRMRDHWRDLLKLQLLLSLTLAPLTLLFFQGASWIGPLANLLALPAMALLLPALLAALSLAFAWPAIGVPALKEVADAIGWAYGGLQWIAAHAPHPWLLMSAPIAALSLALIGVLLLCAPRGLPLRRLALLCFVPLLLPAKVAPERGFELTALDVGQGLAVVVRTAHHAMLFDAGPAFEEGFDAGRSVVVPYLLHEGLARLDLMMISHADLDHRGGAPAVRRLIEVTQERGAMAGTPCAAGQSWKWDEVQFIVLSGPPPVAELPAASDSADVNEPAKTRGSHSSNNEGCVLRIAAGDHAVLLPADIERGVEAQLVAAESGLLRADVLLAPHHGSKTSSTPIFVDAVAPRLVIFPAGMNNPFHHPRAEVVARYAAEGAQMLMTGNSGAISLHVDPARGIEDLREWRRQSPRLWSAPIPAVPADNH